MDISELLTELNILLGDTDNFTFTPEEKTRALKEAIRDKFVVNRVKDSSLTYSTTTQTYTIPTTITSIRSISYNNTDNWPVTLPSDAWQELDGTLYIENAYRYQLPDGATLTINGNYKITSDDTVSDVNLQEYILTLAHYNTLKLLGAKKTNRFIKNDTNMNEIIALRRDLLLDIREKRQSLVRNYERV